MRTHIKNTKDIVSRYIDMFINEDDICLDATIGNGNDINRIADKIGYGGKVYGFDIQDIALENTKNLLDSQGNLDKVTLIKDGHENLDYYINEKLNFIIYNLGYLPKGDKNIKTNDTTTIISMTKALNMMATNSIMLITAYLGHPGGKDENYAVKELLSSLNQKIYNVVGYEFINQRNNPPILYAVEKL